MVDDVVRSKAHPEQCACWVEVAWHSRPAVHVLSETLKQQMRTPHIEMVLLTVRVNTSVLNLLLILY